MGLNFSTDVIDVSVTVRNFSLGDLEVRSFSLGDLEVRSFSADVINFSVNCSVNVIWQ